MLEQATIVAATCSQCLFPTLQLLLLVLPFMPCLSLLLPRLQACVLRSRADSGWAGAAAAAAVSNLLGRPQPLLLLQLLVGLLLGRLWCAAAATRNQRLRAACRAWLQYGEWAA